MSDAEPTPSPPSTSSAESAALETESAMRALRLAASTSTLSSVCCYGLNRCIIQAQAADGQPILLACQHAINITSDAARALLRDAGLLGSLVVHNGQYSKWRVEGSAALLFDDVEMVKPSTIEAVEKYTKVTGALQHFTESAEQYDSIVLPWIRSLPDSHFRWIYNILDGLAEVDRVLMKDPDFVLVKNFSWTSDEPSGMHALAIVTDRSLFCLRELRSHHVTMLKRMHDLCVEKLQQLYGFTQEQICARFHYLPTFYHLHLHFEVRSNCEYGSHRYRDFDEVLSVLSVVPDGYQRMTLAFNAKPGGKGVPSLLAAHSAASPKA